MSKALLYDATQCIGCKLCEEACAESNGLPYDDAIAEETVQSSRKFTVVLSEDGGYMRRLCMHCLDPTCASVCPVVALEKTADGPVVYHEDRCIGCRYCMLACPFSVPRYEWDKALPGVRKCTLCAERLKEGRPTACSEACPAEAVLFGERDDLLEIARARLRENPEQYIDHIYGENEVGGTSVLLLSKVPFEKFGYSVGLEGDPLPMLTYRVLSRIPDMVMLGGVLLGGIWWITNRRNEVAAAEGRAGVNEDPDSGERES